MKYLILVFMLFVTPAFAIETTSICRDIQSLSTDCNDLEKQVLIETIKAQQDRNISNIYYISVPKEKASDMADGIISKITYSED